MIECVVCNFPSLVAAEVKPMFDWSGMQYRRLRSCWALPDATAHVRAVLLHGQLRNLMRVGPWYVASNIYTGGMVLYELWPFVQDQP
jgi:hypothetical protein